MTANDTPSAAEALELVAMLHRASELAPLPKADHINCDNALRLVDRFFGTLDDAGAVAGEAAEGEAHEGPAE